MQRSYFNYWGKSCDSGLDGVAWHLLAYHSLDVAAVGWRWFEADPALRQRLCRLLGFARCEQKTAKNLIAFLLAMHDLGKFADAFQGLQNGIRQTLGKTGNPPQYQTRHDSLGYELWRHKFVRQIDFGKWGGLAYDEDWFQLKTRDIPQKLIELLLASAFGHHGFPPKIENTCRNHFTQSDIEAAQEFCREVYGLFNPHFPEAFDESKIHVATIWLAGFFTICDWIGSNSAIFIYQNKAQYDLKDYFEKIALERAEQALKESGLLYATPKAFSTAKELFSYLKDLTPLQKICAEIGIQNQEPALYILEDVTGSGKTEAAMILVQRLMEAHGLAGFYLGLPTMATANGMYQRMSCYYRKMYEENSHPSLVLAHGQRQLNDGFHESILAFSARDRSYAAGEETASALCASWLSDDARKSLLGHCGIGTVDQSLLAILTSRFHTVRLFGLLQKVLVLDEVHAYDAYTNQLICNLLEAQARAGLPVVLLSATLPQKLRKQFAKSYLLGLSRENGDIKLCSDEYPLITIVSSQKIQELPLETREEVKRTVKVELLHDEQEVLSKIAASIDGGHCVCWVRDTVHDAIEAYEKLETKHGNNLMLFHARFIMQHRLAIENKVLKSFGPQSNGNVRSGKILIATQVVEQSLDLDFDTMITDLAPIDLVIQRAGRLRRHRRDSKGNRVSKKTDERGEIVLYVYSPKVVEDPPRDWYREKFPHAAYVYADHSKLYLTAKWLSDNNKQWEMPKDARSMIEAVYGENVSIPAQLREMACRAENRDVVQESIAQVKAIHLGGGYDFVNYQHAGSDFGIFTRFTDEPQARVFLAQESKTGEILPLFGEPSQDNLLKLWFGNSLNIPERFLDQGLITQMQNCLKEKLPAFLKNEIVLVFQPKDYGFFFEASEKVKMFYTMKKGLEIKVD